MGVEHIIEEEQRNIGGQLGAASGARRRTYERLKAYIEKTKDSLFPPTPELLDAHEEIYKYPLQEPRGIPSIASFAAASMTIN